MTESSGSDSESRSAAELRTFIERARSAAWGRLGFWIAVDAALFALAWGVIAVAVTAWTLRGDLAAQAWTVIVAGTSVVGVAFGIRHGVRKFGNAQRASRTIARNRQPLSAGSLPPKQVAAHQLLRHELLAALELLDAGKREQPSVRSPELVDAYVEDVARRLKDAKGSPTRAISGPRARPRAIAAAVLGVLIAACSTWSPLMGGLALMLSQTDGRPPRPIEPVWSKLTLELTYPDHTGRPNRTVPNPSGGLRVPAGTTVALDLLGRRPAHAARVVVTYDPTELTAAPAPELIDLAPAGQQGLHWTGSFDVRATGTWTVVLFDDEPEDQVVGEDARSSAPMPVELEVDRAPEIELLPLPRNLQEVGEGAEVDVRFMARDDFGLDSAELVYQLPQGESHRLQAAASEQPRTWRHRFTWDISQIPIRERSEVLYWVEIRDNDPGLGIDPLPDPPGKVTRSATMRLVVRDDESEHAANIANLAQIRDAAVDLLAQRMITRAFARQPSAPPDDLTVALPPVGVRAGQARDLLRRSQNLLAMLSGIVDAMSVDTLVRERDVATITSIHKRLVELHRKELELHTQLPLGSERADPQGAADALLAMAAHNRTQTRQLEDEIIRIDDLVDGQIIERLEALVARLEATQRKLVELLEQLKAGDESVRPQIDQLEQRRREDMRRIAEARAMLRSEVDEEFMNLDAFEVLQRMAQSEQLSEMLRRGDVDEALEQARGELGDVGRLRDQVQQRAGDAAEQNALSEEERRIIQLLRELSRLQDDQANLRTQTRELHENWRSSVSEQKSGDSDRKRAERTAKRLGDALDKINDARLGRQGRRGLEDAKAEIKRLERLAQREGTGQLELAESAERIARGLAQAKAGSAAKEKEGKAIARELESARKLFDGLDRQLPRPGETLAPEALQRLAQVRRRQKGLRKKSTDLLGSDLAKPLPGAGRRAMRSAERGMGESQRELERDTPRDALPGQSRSWNGIQEAIDSLRRGSPPPPPSGGGEASTEADRDRSLRDELMDAMREDAPQGFDEPVKRYYQELLR